MIAQKKQEGKEPLALALLLFDTYKKGYYSIAIYLFCSIC